MDRRMLMLLGEGNAVVLFRIELSLVRVPDKGDAIEYKLYVHGSKHSQSVFTTSTHFEVRIKRKSLQQKNR